MACVRSAHCAEYVAGSALPTPGERTRIVRMKIFLFDIDGTLIRSGGAGKAAMEAALVGEFGVTELIDKVPYSGRTDRAICRDLLELHGLEPNAENDRRLEESYLRQLPECLHKHGGTVLPGIRPLLDALVERSDCALGLLTGNVRAGAGHKLRHFGLWDYFRFGGFGDRHLDRDDVARTALAAALEFLQREHIGESVWVIGDTPLDVSCARAIGARSVAVATGWHDRDELAACKPDLLYDDLFEWERFLAQVEA